MPNLVLGLSSAIRHPLVMIRFFRILLVLQVSCHITHMIPLTNTAFYIPGPMEDTGLIQSETLPLKTGHQESITEFIHLSIQEFLGMAEISNRSDDVKSFLNVDTTDNESSLTKQFLLGLVFDTKNKWIKAVKKALVQAETNDTKVTEIIKQHVKALCNQLGARVSLTFI